MNSISVLVLFASLSLCARSHPADEPVWKSKSKSTPGDLGLQVEAGKRTKTVSHPTVKCEHIYFGKAPDVEMEEKRDENEACFSHCITLGSQYHEGKCEGGMCHCGREVSPRDNTDRVPTVKCSDLVPETGETLADNVEACKAHCNTLGSTFDGGECALGVCTCRVVQ